jgi:hypothetical protein
MGSDAYSLRRGGRGERLDVGACAASRGKLPRGYMKRTKKRVLTDVVRVRLSEAERRRLADLAAFLSKRETSTMRAAVNELAARYGIEKVFEVE